MLVYLAYCIISQKCYVGKTTQSLRVRWNRHCLKARQGSLTYFHCALRKYGPAAFELVELAHAIHRGALNQLECDFIMLHRSHQRAYGYNLTLGGDGGASLSAESRARMAAGSLKNIGRKKTPKTLQRMSEAATNRWSNLQQRQAQSKRFTGAGNPFWGKMHSEITRQKLRAAKVHTYKHSNLAANHKRWHTNRGVMGASCSLCGTSNNLT